MVALLSHAYTSNLRYFVTLPKYDQEINQDSDADNYSSKIHVAVPEEYVNIYYSFVEKLSSSLYEKVNEVVLEPSMFVMLYFFTIIHKQTVTGN